MLTGFDLARAAMAVEASGPEKSVLLVLAIMANEAAQAWPAISGPAGLTAKSSLGERTVQRAVQSLEAAGHITRTERPGRGVLYTIHPRQSGTPVTATPRHSDAPATEAATPATAAPKQPRTTIPPVASQPTEARAERGGFPKPEWADADHWRDFLANRKRKKLPNTATAHARLLRDVERFTDTDWPPGRILQHAAERGWAGIYDPRESERRNGHRPHHQQSPRHPGGTTLAAFDRAIGQVGG